MWRATYTSESFHGSRAVPFDAGASVLMTQSAHTTALGKKLGETFELSGAGSEVAVAMLGLSLNVMLLW